MKFSEMNGRFLARVAGVAVLYFFAAMVGLQFAVVGSTVTLVWPSSGIALVAVLVLGYRLSAGVAIGALLANVVMGLPILLAGSVAIGNTLEAVVGAWMLTRVGRMHKELDRHRDVFALIVLAALLSTALGAVVGAATLTLGGVVPVADAASVWLIWWLGDMMGVLMVVPPLLIAISHPRPVLSAPQVVEALGLLALLLIACNLIFGAPQLAGHGYFPAALAVMPFVVWGALRFEYFGATLVALLISGLAAWGTAQGTGPFAEISKTGSLVRWSIFANLMAMTGLLLAVSSASHRQSQVALRAALDELTRQKMLAEQANKAKSSYIAVASHDLRQPLHAIALYVAALQPTLAGRSAASTLDKIQSCVTCMENMCGAVLDVSKLDAGVVVPEIECLPAKSLLEGLYNDFCHQAAAKGLTLRVRLLNVSVSSDPTLLPRILRNLIDNALRYTGQGGVLISARRYQGSIRFQVWDTGFGIAPENTKAIFQEHFQVPGPQHRNPSGQGLGLSIVDRLTHLLDYPLTVRSQPGRGTVFSVDVPVCLEVQSLMPRDNPPPSGIGQLQGRVLIVDDDAMVLDSLKSLLETWGLKVAMASAATDFPTRATGAPDLLITDYHLGPQDGLAVAVTLRDRYPNAAFPVIIMTGDTTSAGAQRLRDSGHHVLHKPVRPARLRALVTHLLLAQHRALD
jgi:signal transduction histidine kinase